MTLSVSKVTQMTACQTLSFQDPCAIPCHSSHKVLLHRIGHGVLRSICTGGDYILANRFLPSQTLESSQFKYQDTFPDKSEWGTRILGGSKADNIWGAGQASKARAAQESRTSIQTLSRWPMLCCKSGLVSFGIEALCSCGPNPGPNRAEHYSWLTPTKSSIALLPSSPFGSHQHAIVRLARGSRVKSIFLQHLRPADFMQGVASSTAFFSRSFCGFEHRWLAQDGHDATV